MILGRLTPAHLLSIRQPRWHDRVVLLAEYKLGTHNEVVFTHAKTLPGRFYVSGAVAKTYPLENNGKLDVRAVPLDKLEPLERAV